MNLEMKRDRGKHKAREHAVRPAQYPMKAHME